VAKKKTSFRSAAKQAAFAAQCMGLDSVRTEKNYEQALTGLTQFIQAQKLGDLHSLTKETAERYLALRSQEVGQKSLDLDRQAIQAVLGEKLAVTQSEKEQVLKSRAYTPAQVTMVANAQSEKNALATQIAESAGLRAHELLTLRRVTERPADTHRPYRNDRFTGRQHGVLYTVEGKGGLCREVILDQALAAKLEERRLETPRIVFDREVRYASHYDIGGGQAWSNSFSAASKRTLGWSTGAHGLRHEYAQARMNELQGAGYEYRQALTVVSEEMGHFRPDITEVYLR